MAYCWRRRCGSVALRVLKAHKSHTTLTWTMAVKTFDFARDSKVFQSYFWLRSTKHTQSAKRRVRLASTRTETPNKTVAKDDTNFSLMRSDSIRCCGSTQTCNFFVPATYRRAGYYNFVLISFEHTKSSPWSPVDLFIFSSVRTSRSQRLLELDLPNLLIISLKVF